MYKDLKEFAESEDTIKYELSEHKSRRLELEGMVEELRQVAHSQEVKLRSQQVEHEKIRKESAIKSESLRFVEQDVESLRNENE